MTMPPTLPDDLLREILLRLPPQPSSLLRASLVCKHWRSLVTDPRFIQRLGASVLGGVFYNNPPVPFPSFIPAGDPPDSIPASRFQPPPAGHRGYLMRDCRRGRALLQNCSGLVVWDPWSPEKQPHLVPEPTTSVCGRFFFGFGAVLLREDDGSFRVAIGLVDSGIARASVYSSDTGSWGTPVTAPAPTSRGVPWKEKPGAVVGDTVYWLLNDDRVLSLELCAGSGSGSGLQVLTVLEPRNVPTVEAQNVQLMTTPDCDKLGLASLTASAMRLWTLEIDGHSTTSWRLRRTVLLDALLPTRPVRRRQRHPDHIVGGGAVGLALALVLHQHKDNDDSTPCTARIVGVHEDGGMVFLKNGHVLFMLQLEPTLRIKRMGGMFIMRHGFTTVYPYGPYSSIFL